MDDKDFLLALKDYIEGSEVKIDAEWGDCRPLGELIADGDMPPIYAEVLRRIEIPTHATRGETMEWQPIETAPKDGTRILIGRVGHPWVFSAWWNERHTHWATGNSPMGFFASPTHWMPLPEAPNASNEGPELATVPLD